MKKTILFMTLLMMSVNMLWSQGALTNVTFHDRYNMGMDWEHCSLNDVANSTYYRLNVQMDRQTLLTQEHLEKIWKKAATDAKNDSCYTADAIRQFLAHFKTNGYALPQVFSYREEEDKVVKFMQKICEKGKAAKDSEKELWRRYYTAYLRDVYVHEAETIVRERDRQEAIKDSMVRNDWSKSRTWIALKDYRDRDYTLTDSVKLYGEFIANNRLSLNHINKFYYAQIHKEQQIFKDMYKLSSIYGHGGFYESFIKDSLLQNYKTILKEINYSPKRPKMNGDIFNYGYGRIDDSVLYTLFQKDKEMVGELRRYKNKYTEIDTSADKYLWMICHSNEFRRRVNVWLNTPTLEYPSNGVIKDTIKPVWNSENMYIVSIPYYFENGVLVPNGTCTVRQTKPQSKNATGEQFEIYTYDVTMTVTVEKGKATSKSVKGFVCQWDENTAAGQGKKNEFERRKAIRMAKPVVKKKIIHKS